MLYKVNLEADAERANSIEIDIRLDEPSVISVFIESWGGKTWEQTKEYDRGIHSLSLSQTQITSLKEPIAIRSIEVRSQKENVLCCNGSRPPESFL